MKADAPKNRGMRPTDLLTGRFLTSQLWARNWPFVIYVSIMALIMIASSHSADRKVHRITQLQEQVRELSAQYTDLRSRLMNESLESKVTEKAARLGLRKPNVPPRRITIKTQER